MIILKEINDSNFNDIIRLRAKEKFVATNAYSLVEAYFNLKLILENKLNPKYQLFPKAIYNAEILIGF